MYRIITIEREYASGGSEIGKQLAKELNCTLYDRNILVMAAARLEIPPSYMENLEETGPGTILFNLSRTVLGGSIRKEDNIPLAERLFLAEKEIVEEIVQKECCIIIGRAAGYLLKDHKDCLRIFIHADHDCRLKRAIEREGCAPADAEAVLKKNDKRRRSFYEYHTSLTWGNRADFDLCLNSSRLGIGKCVDIIREAVQT
ncbi:MAG: cytidylate kinase-like family protein [Clostridiales bacterium]|nr:cytidylate kinase-like family protein [Clostridiales bacterium]